MIRLAKAVLSAAKRYRKKRSKKSRKVHTLPPNSIYRTTDSISFVDYSFASTPSPRNPMGWTRGNMDIVEASTKVMSSSILTVHKQTRDSSKKETKKANTKLKEMKEHSNKVQSKKKSKSRTATRSRDDTKKFPDYISRLPPVCTDTERPPVLFESEDSNSDSRTSTTDSEVSDSCLSDDSALDANIVSCGKNSNMLSCNSGYVDNERRSVLDTPLLLHNTSPLVVGPVPFVVVDLNSEEETKDDIFRYNNLISPLSRSAQIRVEQSGEAVSEMLQNTIDGLLELRSSASIRLATDSVEDSYLSLNTNTH